jgi:hypothetical protein
VLAQTAEYEVQEALDHLSGVPTPLMVGGQGDADVHPPRVVLSAVQPAIPDHEPVRRHDDRELEPRSWDVRLQSGLAVDQPCGLVRPEGLPVLVAGHLGQRPVGAQRRQIVAPQAAENEPRRAQLGKGVVSHAVPPCR